MAFITCRFFSDVLEMGMTLNVIVPDVNRVPVEMQAQVAQGDLPVLFLLHGLSDDESAWTRNSSIERYANEVGMAVVMPNVHRSFYTDMPTGQNYFTYVAEEVPAVARRLFPITGDPRRTYVGGLSMGGYGAFKVALCYPEQFGAAVSLSGLLDVTQTFPEDLDDMFQTVFDQAFGKGVRGGSKHDLFQLLEEAVRAGKPLPRLLQACGTEDFLYPGNVRFRTLAEQLQVPGYAYVEGPGKHDWDYWDAEIRPALRWLLGK